MVGNTGWSPPPLSCSLSHAMACKQHGSGQSRRHSVGGRRYHGADLVGDRATVVAGPWRDIDKDSRLLVTDLRPAYIYAYRYGRNPTRICMHTHLVIGFYSTTEQHRTTLEHVPHHADILSLCLFVPHHATFEILLYSVTTGDAYSAVCQDLCRVQNIEYTADNIFAVCCARQRMTHGLVTNITHGKEQHTAKNYKNTRQRNHTAKIVDTWPFRCVRKRRRHGDPLPCASTRQ